jgi:hypothetical protein
MRVAVFSAQPQPGLEFTCIVAANKKRGADMRTFISEQDARQWLASQEAASAEPHSA